MRALNIRHRIETVSLSETSAVDGSAFLALAAISRLKSGEHAETHPGALAYEVRFGSYKVG